MWKRRGEGACVAVVFGERIEGGVAIEIGEDDAKGGDEDCWQCKAGWKTAEERVEFSHATSEFDVRRRTACGSDGDATPKAFRHHERCLWDLDSAARILDTLYHFGWLSISLLSMQQFLSTDGVCKLVALDTQILRFSSKLVFVDPAT